MNATQLIIILLLVAAIVAFLLQFLSKEALCVSLILGSLFGRMAETPRRKNF
jgi:hypothetical protein